MICPYCEEPIGDLDPSISINGDVLIHRECMLRQVAGSVGHQLGRCSCKGGSLEDPPGMTRREAASAAAYLYSLLDKWGVQ